MPFRFILKLVFMFLSLTLLCCVFAACSLKESDDETSNNVESTLLVSTTKKDEVVTTEEAKKSSDESDTYIILDNENTIISGNGASFENNTLTVSKGGTYSVSGTLSDGKIYVNSADENKKVKIIFDGVSIFCSTDAPFFVENSPEETIIILSDGSDNFLSDSAREVPQDANAEYATAALYSKDDLQIEGGGSLTVTGVFNKGIFSKNDIDIRGGKITVTAADDGIRGKDSVEISAGNITVNAGGDGIRTSETQQQGKGSIAVSGGNISVVSELDGIQATADVIITGGKINLTCGGGATGNISSDEMMPGRPMNAGRPNKTPMGFIGGRPGGYPGDSSALESQTQDTPSQKGIKADGQISFSGGEIGVSSLDDSIHAQRVVVENGKLTLNTDDDGIHADESITVSGGEINIINSFEGIEAKLIEIDGGNIILKSVDDGFNAADGSSSSGGMMPPNMAADENCKIIIEDGYVHIDADGDGIDSNGNVTMNGGTLIVFGPESGANGALDYAGTYTVSGGTLLALGAAGMAQSVTAEDSAGVVAFNYSQGANTLVAITESDGDMCIAFKNTKSYSTVVFASDDIDPDDSYNVYYGGSVRGESKNSVYFEGEYEGGTLVGAVSS